MLSFKGKNKIDNFYIQSKSFQFKNTKTTIPRIQLGQLKIIVFSYPYNNILEFKLLSTI